MDNIEKIIAQNKAILKMLDEAMEQYKALKKRIENLELAEKKLKAQIITISNQNKMLDRKNRHLQSSINEVQNNALNSEHKNNSNGGAKYGW